MSRLSNIGLVRQEDPNGCLVACMAMIAGLSYQDVRALFPRVAQGGLTHYAFMDFLARHDFAYQFLFKFDQTNYAVRDDWPRAPWADAHICGVDAGRGGESSHGVVLLRDGTILDPMADAPRRMSDYPKCGYMCGIFDVRP